ncbi:MAG: PqqD family protein [Gemmatimonadaceae bacterium]|nr:PqqD family protein [Gemmatimonadaceae bacterium]MCW5827295.1 PqqD family protein [Gemmatimonadaceae bacterium]
MKPVARKDNLVTQRVGDETLVYDGSDESARRLNALSSIVWRHCTGENTIAEIAVLVASEIALPADVEATEVVERALAELDEHGLLVDSGLEGAGAAGGMARRDAVKLLAAIPLFPSIDRIFAPTMANSASLPPDASLSASASPTSSRSGSGAFFP